MYGRLISGQTKTCSQQYIVSLIFRHLNNPSTVSPLLTDSLLTTVQRMYEHCHNQSIEH
uniref:Uncharacterized protein n=1 Tax=Anguilla anguilla TaxID=7936 RepID=A0A0E9X3T5_ANGAN